MTLFDDVRPDSGGSPGMRSGGALDGMTVGIAAISLGGGGAERQAALWAHAGVREGARVRVLALEAAERPYALPDEAQLQVLGKRSRRDAITGLRDLRRFGRACDAVVAFQPYMGLLCLVAGVRRYAIVTGQDPRHWRDTSRVPGPLFSAAFRRARAATAPSRGLIACHRDLGLRPSSDRWLHVPNVVAHEAFAEPDLRTAREGVLFVGRLVPEKQPELALRAATAARLPITFLGDGPLRAELQAAANRLGVEHLVRFHAFTPSPWELFARHRVLVLTSRYETFANVIVESLAAGTSVVSVDCDFGPREILEGARFSRLTPTDADALSAALAAVSATPPSDAERAECARIAGRYRESALAPAIAGAIRGVAA